jgi:serine protease Do
MKKSIIAAVILLSVGVFIGILLVSNVTPNLIDEVFGQDKDVKIGADNAPVILDEPSKVLNNALVAASEATVPTVVSLNVEVKLNNSRRPQFHDFFEFFDMPEGERKSRGMGSGVIISEDGYIITNNHVVENAVENGIEITTNDKKKYKAKLIGSDPLTDLAVIKIDAEDGEKFHAAHIGDMEKVRIGEMVIAVGNPLGLHSTVTSGIVSAIGRGQFGMRRSNYSVENYIQTDAAINPGNSGGGLFDLNGSLIGINTAIATETGNYIGYGFAIPIDLAMAVIDDLIDDGKINRGYIGVTIENVDELFAKKFGLDEVKGVIVMDILPGKAADKAGIKSGDVILKVDDKEVNTTSELQSSVVFYRAGDEITLTIWRDGKEIKKKVVLQKRDDDVSDITAGESNEEEESEISDDEPVTFEDLGFKVDPITPQIKEEYEVENGVVISNVERFSIASDRGMFRGGVITKVDDEKIKSPKDLKKIIEGKSSGDVVLMYIKFQERNQIVALELP